MLHLSNGISIGDQLQFAMDKCILCLGHFLGYNCYFTLEISNSGHVLERRIVSMYHLIAIVDFKEVWDNVVSLYWLLKAVHTGDKPFKCDECDKTFRTQLELQSHMGRHTGVKPFQCDICHKEFISTITFKRHAIVHSGKMEHWRALRLFINYLSIISTEFRTRIFGFLWFCFTSSSIRVIFNRGSEK